MFSNQTKLYAAFIVALIVLGALRIFSRKQIIRLTDETILRVGTAAEFPPFEFIKDGELVGFDIDLIHAVAQKLGKKIIIKDMPFTTLIPQAQRGSLQILASGLTPTPERAEELLFTKPYLMSDPLMVVTLAKNSPMNSIDDLKGKSVIVNDGFSAERYMSEISGIDLKRLPTVADAFLSLNSGRADAFVTAANTLKPFFKQASPAHYSTFIIPNTNDQTAFAISKKYPQLLEEVQKALDALEHDGFIETLKTKWDIA